MFSLVSPPTDSHELIDSSCDLNQASGLLDTDLSERLCLSDNITLISNESSPSVMVDLSSHLPVCDYSSVNCVTGALVEPCGSVLDPRDIVQDLFYQRLVWINSISPTMDLSRDLLHRD